MEKPTFGLSAPIRQFLPHILVALALVAVVAASYSSVLASSSSPKVLWSTNPLTISFNSIGLGSSGSAGDSFKCAPSVTNVVLTTSVSSSKIKLTVSPATQASCGPPFNPETITATCQTLTAAACKGTYVGTVTVHNGSQYGNTIAPSLAVNIVVN